MLHGFCGQGMIVGAVIQLLQGFESIEMFVASVLTCVISPANTSSICNIWLTFTFFCLAFPSKDLLNMFPR